MQKEPDWRTVVCIIDPAGNNGKSAICDYLENKGVAKKCLVPMHSSCRQLMRAVCRVGAQRCYLMDMPRIWGTPKDRLACLYEGIEKIKNGFAYDERHSYKELHIMEPHVVVFTNKWPDLHLLSVDRWQLYCVIDHELVRVKLPVEHNPVDTRAWLAKYCPTGTQLERMVHVDVDVEEWVKKQCPDVVLTALPVPTEPLSWAIPVPVAVAAPVPAPVPVPVAAPVAAAAQPRKRKSRG